MDSTPSDYPARRSAVKEKRQRTFPSTRRAAKMGRRRCHASQRQFAESAASSKAAQQRTGLLMNRSKTRLVAIARDVSPAIGQCELTHLPRQAIDWNVAARQHDDYCKVLESLGCELRKLPASPDLPDCVFVEDSCVVLDELAVIARPGAESRREETRAVADVLREFRQLRFLEAPGTLDGGDVLRLGRHLYVGRSRRTNEAGIEQLRAVVEPIGYRVVAVPIAGCLHLKSAVSQVGDRVLLVNRHWLDPSCFEGMDLIEVDESEPMAANALRIADTIVYPMEFPRTRRKLEDWGIRICPVAMSELGKAEGGVTCCSVLVS
jgi:dimethylargininase